MRVEMVKTKINGIIRDIKNTEWQEKAYIHSYGVAQAAALLAQKRDLNAELAVIMGLLHDIYAYTACSYELHDEKGAAFAAKFLTEMNIFEKEEIELVSNAILYHDKRADTHATYDELLKDADILQPYLYTLERPKQEVSDKRLSKVLNELGL